MKAFTEIAIPHRDILEGRLRMETYAADLWEVAKGTAPEEYRDREIFLERTYETQGLKQIITEAEKRLRGENADSVIQLQTPFGGGKTHTLIYLYHKAKQWGANVVVFCGDKVGAKDNTIWEEMEKQLSGKIERFKGKVPPGGEALKAFLKKHEPLLILMDEVHHYLVSALTEMIGDSTLSAQSLVFIQSLTNVVKTMEKTAVFMSLPASSPYGDESSERLLNNLKQIVGRVERVYTPVSDEEVADVIRRRLFSRIDEDKVKKIVKEFLDYAERETLLPEGMEKSFYRDRFLRSYPFQPDVIDVLYKRWGSFPTFQRTRGVLRLLAMVVYSLVNLKRPYIRLADFNLSNEEIRRELIKHIGSEYDSIIAQDITSPNSGAKRVDKLIGDSYRPYYFGTSVATTIFMYSFSGGPEKGATTAEVKLSSAETAVSSSIIVETIEKLKEQLFYLSDEGLFFTNQPNLNRVLIDKMDSIGPDKIESFEEELLKSRLEKCFETYIFPRESKDISDTPSLKLIILNNRNGLEEILHNHGDRPRIYKNSLIFLTQDPTQKTRFENEIKKRIAWEMIENDKTLRLTDQQKREIKERIKKAEASVKAALRDLYRKVYLPSRDGLKEIDMGIGIYGSDRGIDKEVYERLRQDGELVMSIAPMVLLEKYLKEAQFSETKKIYEAFVKVPGELRICDQEAFKTAVKKGVREGIFGLGRLENDKPVCLYFKEDCEVELNDGEILIKKEECEEKYETLSVQKTEPIEGIGISAAGTVPTDKPMQLDLFSQMRFEIRVPAGNFSNFVRTLNYIKSKFKHVSVKITLEAMEGEISKAEYEDKIKEAFRQSEIVVEKEELD
ncbi:DUF499 domain-containing protein [Thermodesulfovibrio sp. 3907-1M]|uniref:DUF499 domain-containing protein n=1 Tax=Thermodesulfovibrio autotrophicus TaxID=3118333 RepID=A0AAU8H0H5_9BACT